MPSYVEQGLIVESQVYTAIYNVYKGNDLTNEDKAFIIDEVNLEINAE